MPLSLPQPPAAALRAVLDALDDPSAVRAVRTAAMRRSTGLLAPANPLPVHLLDPVASYPQDSPLAGARRTGWRFLIRDGDEVLAAADTVESPEGQAFSHFAEGPYPLSTLRALQQAAQHTGGAPTVYLPRLLSVPGHYMAALWLHPILDRAQSADLLIPLAPAPLGVTAHLPHHADELLALLAVGSRQLLTATG
jgi:hypothetical protein